jgi:hypothetical protein
MWHTLELALILLLLAVEQGVMDLSARPGRRVAVNFVVWALAFAVGTYLLSAPDLATPAVGIGILLLGAYIVRWVIGGIVQQIRAPQLFETPGEAQIAAVAHQATRVPLDQCRRVARRILRSTDGDVALLALMSLKPADTPTPENLETGWRTACSDTYSAVLDLVVEHGVHSREQVRAADVWLVAQALCVYGRASVERILDRLPSPALGSRARRQRLAQRLGEAGSVRKEAEMAGLAAPKDRQERDRGRRFRLAEAAWPPLAFARVGLIVRGWALGISQSLMAAYGILALSLGRDSGWIFLAVAVLLQVQALFVVHDLAGAAGRAHESSEEGGRP